MTGNNQPSANKIRSLKISFVSQLFSIAGLVGRGFRNTIFFPLPLNSIKFTGGYKNDR